MKTAKTLDTVTHTHIVLIIEKNAVEKTVNISKKNRDSFIKYAIVA